MLTDPQKVFSKAEEMAAKYKQMLFEQTDDNEKFPQLQLKQYKFTYLFCAQISEFKPNYSYKNIFNLQKLICNYSLI